MTGDDLIAALELPADVRIDRRVPKSLLVQHGSPTPADTRTIQEAIDEIVWLAALKPTGIGVPAFSDETREYLEIAVLRLRLRCGPAEGAKSERLVELVHRAIPYPVVAIVESVGSAGLSLAHKRWSQAGKGNWVLDGDPVSTNFVAVPAAGVSSDALQAFREAMAIVRQPRASLHALYQGWIDTVTSLQVARLTGVFAPPSSPVHASERRAALHECSRLEGEVAALRAAAAKERQMAKQVEANMRLKRLQADLAAARGRL